MVNVRRVVQSFTSQPDYTHDARPCPSTPSGCSLKMIVFDDPVGRHFHAVATRDTVLTALGDEIVSNDDAINSGIRDDTCDKTSNPATLHDEAIVVSRPGAVGAQSHSSSRSCRSFRQRR